MLPSTALRKLDMYRDLFECRLEWLLFDGCYQVVAELCSKVLLAKDPTPKKKFRDLHNG